MNSTHHEIEMLLKVSGKVEEVRKFLSLNVFDKENQELDYWYRYITQIKKILGNLDNDVSFIACLMAKSFLCQHHRFTKFDVAAKPQSAPGLDIDEITVDGERVIAEIKTTIPYGEIDLGAQQKETFYKDFKKLQNNEATHKYFFVTELRTFEIFQQRYLTKLQGVKLVLLPQALLAKEGDSTEYVLDSSLAGSFLSKREDQKTGHNIRTIKNSGLAERIRAYFLRKIIEPAREAGTQKIRVMSGDIAIALKLTSRYPAICSAMEGSKIEKYCRVKVLNKEGSFGAHFFVTYEL